MAALVATSPGSASYVLFRGTSQIRPGYWGSAIFSPDDRYRYQLDRWWAGQPRDRSRRWLWVALNPAKASEGADDHTSKKIGEWTRLGQGLGAGALARPGTGYTLANLAAYCTSSPRVLREQDDPYGPLNGEYLRQLLADAAEYGQTVVFAWGGDGKHHTDQALEAWELARAAGVRPLCLGETLTGHPKHPARLSPRTELRYWDGPDPDVW